MGEAQKDTPPNERSDSAVKEGNACIGEFHFGIVFLVLLSSSVLERTQFHSRLQGFATERGLPVFGSLYRGIDEKRPENIIFGSITEITDDGFVLETDTDESLKVFISEETRQRPNTMYGIGDTVLVFGDRIGTSSVDALGVRPHQQILVVNRSAIKDLEVLGLIMNVHQDHL